MTKKQTEEMDKLAIFIAGDPKYYYDDPSASYTKENVEDIIFGFQEGYRAAQQPDQLILNEHVKGLVEMLKTRYTNSLGPTGTRIDVEIDNVLKPFRDLGTDYGQV